MNQKIKVIIADDHDVYRDGLKILLNSDPDIDVIAEARTGDELIEKACEHSPDVILTDLIMRPGKNGIDAIKELYETGFRRFIAISTFDSEQLIIEALQAGASGYIIKHAKRDEIVVAIKEVFAYKKYYCKFTSARLPEMIEELQLNPPMKKKQDLFSENEKEIIRLLCEEKTSEEIGAALFMSKRTVDGIRQRIKIKMNVKNTGGIILYSIRNRLFTPDPGLPDNWRKNDRE
jgi:DNA-binding NarL/FixJ family response regulator